MEFDGLFGVRRRLKQKLARFRQINLDQPTMHHDALEFPDGEIVLVTELREGQHATVLQLPAQRRQRDQQTDRRVVEVNSAKSVGLASTQRGSNRDRKGTC